MSAARVRLAIGAVALAAGVILLLLPGTPVPAAPDAASEATASTAVPAVRHGVLNVLGGVLLAPGLVFLLSGVGRGLRTPVALACLAVGAVVAIAGGLGPLPAWLGWLLLLPGLAFGSVVVPRRVLQPLAILLLVDGALAACQPWSIGFYGWSTALLLVAIVLFTASNHQADDGREAQPPDWLPLAGALALLVGAVLVVQPFVAALFWPGVVALAVGTVARVAAAAWTGSAPATAAGAHP